MSSVLNKKSMPVRRSQVEHTDTCRVPATLSAWLLLPSGTGPFLLPEQPSLSRRMVVGLELTRCVFNALIILLPAVTACVSLRSCGSNDTVLGGEVRELRVF